MSHNDRDIDGIIRNDWDRDGFLCQADSWENDAQHEGHLLPAEGESMNGVYHLQVAEGSDRQVCRDVRTITCINHLQPAAEAYHEFCFDKQAVNGLQHLHPTMDFDFDQPYIDSPEYDRFFKRIPFNNEQGLCHDARSIQLPVDATKDSGMTNENGVGSNDACDITNQSTAMVNSICSELDTNTLNWTVDDNKNKSYTSVPVLDNQAPGAAATEGIMVQLDVNAPTSVSAGRHLLPAEGESMNGVYHLQVAEGSDRQVCRDVRTITCINHLQPAAEAYHEFCFDKQAVNGLQHLHPTMEADRREHESTVEVKHIQPSAGVKRGYDSEKSGRITEEEERGVRGKGRKVVEEIFEDVKCGVRKEPRAKNSPVCSLSLESVRVVQGRRGKCPEHGLVHLSGNKCNKKRRCGKEVCGETVSSVEHYGKFKVGMCKQHGEVAECLCEEHAEQWRNGWFKARPCNFENHFH